MLIKARYDNSKNYFALFIGNEQTIRFSISDNNEIEKLPYLDSEMYDIAINNKCAGGCDYCYISAMMTGTNYENIVDKAVKLFDRPVTKADPDIVREGLKLYFKTDVSDFINIYNVPQSTKPFQIAIGGAGEPTMHPDFPEFLKTIYQLDIVPNFTTNGMHLPPKVLEAADKYVGGISVTLHEHLEKYWRKAIKVYSELDIKLHVHQIIYDETDTKKMQGFIEEYPDITVVLLPFQHVGFGASYPEKDLKFYDKLFATIVDNKWENRVAYGAGFYEYLLSNNVVNASLYEPHGYSCYLDLKDDVSLYRTSFEWEHPIQTEVLK